MTFSCFITASTNEDTSTIRHILKSQGVDVRDAFDFKPGDEISATITEQIRRSSFVVAVLTNPTPNVYFEVGLAEGMRKPVLLIGKTTDSIPLLQKKPHLQAGVDDSDLLKIGLFQFLAEVRQGKARRRKPMSRGISHRFAPRIALEEYLSTIDQYRITGNTFNIEKLVAAVFETIGAGAVKNELSPQDKGIDFAMWNDKLSQSLGNPLLIEVKAGDLSEDRLNQAEKQLLNFIEDGDAQSGLLLYLDRNGKRFRTQYGGGPLVLRWDIEDFLRDLQKHPFEEAILAKRNLAVHGVDA